MGTSMILLPLLILLQALPPPLGQAAPFVMLGRAQGSERHDLPLPAPRLQSAPAPDCNCGVPASPRGPR